MTPHPRSGLERTHRTTSWSKNLGKVEWFKWSDYLIPRPAKTTLPQHTKHSSCRFLHWKANIKATILHIILWKLVLICTTLPSPLHGAWQHAWCLFNNIIACISPDLGDRSSEMNLTVYAKSKDKPTTDFLCQLEYACTFGRIKRSAI